ncbi:hypothetical protein OJF2_15120 [Aquisphaera giovannonii]|uniref:Glycosyltransferase RgtA/B/C/D-like domain-containing protein n=1 Tax=Aquisphaera giovannonii TaxID=406548 RepID=A0A5B9VYE8_9BACT|nr:hypothetical protein OJF2_15120 [Aquisphaera giovannonii]
MRGSLVSDLGLVPEVWLFLSLLGCVTIFFKFSRVWSVRNLDLLLLFALVPGMMLIVGDQVHPPWFAFLWLFAGSAACLTRCLLDLGLVRRPLLEPNLNASGLLCLSVGILGLLLAETLSLPVHDGALRNPAEPAGRDGRQPSSERDHSADVPVNQVIGQLLPDSLKQEPAQVVLSRVLAMLAHSALVAAFMLIGWRVFDRPIAGLSMAACYLLLPYTRMAVVDSGQLISAALILHAVCWSSRPSLTGVLIGLAAGWIPACLGLIPIWASFYRGRGTVRFLIVGCSVAVVCALLGASIPELARWARALGARSIAEAGLLPWLEPKSPSFWAAIDTAFRLPVLIGYLAMVVVLTIFPGRKSLAELIALSAALLVASQFWYLDKGGTLVLLYLPLVILMMFRPTMVARRTVAAPLQPATTRN